MNCSRLTRLTNIARGHLHKVSGKHRHICVIFRKNKIVSIGYNSHKTHPCSNTKYKSIHAELSAIMRAKHTRNTDMLVIRVAAKDKLRLSKPCQYCQQLVLSSGIRNVWYSTNDGGFELLLDEEEGDPQSCSL